MRTLTLIVIIAFAGCSRARVNLATVVERETEVYALWGTTDGIEWENRYRGYKMISDTGEEFYVVFNATDIVRERYVVGDVVSFDPIGSDGKYIPVGIPAHHIADIEIRLTNR